APSAADVTFLHHLPQSRPGTSNRKAVVESELRRELRNDRVEHREARARDSHSSIVVLIDETIMRECRYACRIERPSGECAIARWIDPVSEPQTHQQKLVTLLCMGQRIVADEAVTGRLDACQPVFRASLRRSRAPRAIDHDPAVSARADARVFVVAPVD